MNIAVFLPNWVGDVVMATPAIRAIRQHFAAARLVAVCRPYVSGVLEGAPWFDGEMFLDPHGEWRHSLPAAAWNLRGEKIDLAILFPNSFRSALTAWLGGCQRIVGFHRDWRGWMLSDRLESLRDVNGNFRPTPVINDYNRLAEAVGCPAPGHRMELFTTTADEAAADAYYEKHRIRASEEVICLNPGAAFGAAKFWPIDSFAELAQILAEQRSAKVIVLCGPNECEQSRAIARTANRTTVHSLADEPLSLGLTKALVRRCTILVTTDSGPRHFAAAFNRPVVSLFGPTFIEWTQTYFNKEICLQKQVSCGPCQLRVCPTDHACMKLLTPEEVLTAIQRLLPSVYQKAS